VHGATLGIVGLGGVGSEVAKRARGFGMDVLYFSRTRKPALEKRYRLAYVPLDELLRRSDFVSLHTALTPETRGIIGRRELSLMKETAVLVNTGRGPLVDQAVLAQALAYGDIAGAALDVTEPEPIAPDDPLLSLENVVITPHIASASVATRSRMADMAVDNLLAALGGRVPKHTANPEAAAAWRRARRRRLAGLS
jgi:glyoxylate reductase